MRTGRTCLLLIITWSFGNSLPVAADEQLRPLQFNRDVRPILSNYCFQCHGPDPKKRKADLRLDLREGLFGDLGGYAAFVPGNLEKSEALKRVLARKMPPPRSKKKPTAQQMEVLRRWVKQGAQWQRHWSFDPPRRAELPKVSNVRWPRNPLDYFILARLEGMGLSPSPEAEPLTLVRRLYLDLIGLPPTPDEADAWARQLQDDPSENTYARLVDHLLASPQHGERWARRWLDLARYADTNGYEKDRPRSIWPYRDWVIGALNQDEPFDQFTIEQLAGDLLPDATLDQLIATGFHRNTMLNEEGGIDPLEYRFHAMTDRVGTTGTVWLGLTIGCAQCHHHKYDPISHHDYYGMMAFLNNADEPELSLPDSAADEQHRKSLQKSEQLLKELPNRWPVKNGQDRASEVEKAFAVWLKHERARSVRWTPIRPSEAKSNLPLLTVQDDDSVFASGDTTKQDAYELAFRPKLEGISAVRLEALPDQRLPGGGPGTTFYEGTKGDFFLGELQVRADGQRVTIAEASHSYAKNRFGKNPVSAQLTIDGDPQTGWSVHDRQGERHFAIFVLKDRLSNVETLRIKMLFGRHYSSSLGRFRISVATSKAQARDLAAEIEELLLMPENELTKEQRRQLFHAFLLTAPQLNLHSEQIRQLQKPPAYPRTLVLRERPSENPRPTFLHHRGEFLRPKERVTPTTPAVLHPFSKNALPNRLGFARWLVDRANPLTARVVVNRHWAAIFGRGIVPTVTDFGFQGEPPSHPKLLDWLAVDFMDNGWSLKKLHRRIVMSATYRQSSRVTPRQRKQDPDNRLLSRAPRFQLEAEILRDSALKASGLLTSKMGGPPVRPPQPPGVTEVAWGSPKWVASQGEDRHRRSVYAYQKRTAPFAMLQTFSAPSGEACVARREVSNSPLQALTLLNDVTFLEAARALGKEIAELKGNDNDRVRHAFRRVLTRSPAEDEIRALVEFAQTQRQRFVNGDLDAHALIGEKGAKAVERATWTALARALLTLDEAITRN